MFENCSTNTTDLTESPMVTPTWHTSKYKACKSNKGACMLIIRFEDVRMGELM